MIIEQFVCNREGNLKFLSGLPCPCFIGLAAFLFGETLIVSPGVKSVGCAFSGRLGYNHSFNIKEKEYSFYKAVVFTSRVSIRLSSLLKSQIELVAFLKDVEEIIEDVELNKEKMPVIGYIGHFYGEGRIERYCKEKGLLCVDMNWYNISDLSTLRETIKAKSNPSHK